MADDTVNEELEDLFKKATQYVRKHAGNIDSKHLLYFYGRYKQAIDGPCKTAKPGFFDFQGKQKWEAWSGLGNLSKKTAMMEYISQLDNIDLSWRKKIEPGDSNQSTGMGVAVSTMMNTDEYIDDEQKTVFDWCKEGNTKQVARILQNQQNAINVHDEGGMYLLHWACDRGYEDMVKVLLDHKADINVQDEDGQTPLHYAVSCEYSAIVNLLLSKSASLGIKDSEGQCVLDLTTSQDISSILQSFSNR